MVVTKSPVKRYIVTKNKTSPRKIGGKKHSPLKSLKKSIKKSKKRIKKSIKKSKKSAHKIIKHGGKPLSKNQTYKLAEILTNTSNKSCKKGQIVRKGYITKRGVVVGATCIKDLGKPGKYSPKKGEKSIVLANNDLGKYGYTNIKNKTATQRRAALKKATVVDGYLKVMRKVNALSVLTRYTDPIFSNRTKMDVEWLKKTYGKK